MIAVDYPAEFNSLCEETGYDYVALAGMWHSGQWSGLYKLSCAGTIVDNKHAWEVWSECRDCLIHAKDEEYEAFDLLEKLLDRLTDSEIPD